MASNAASCQERNVDLSSRGTVLVLALMDGGPNYRWLERKNDNG
jgi:hypothetical protein